MAIDWSILRTDGPVDIAGNFARGFQVGSAIVDKLHRHNALAALAANPDDPRALSALYAVDPSAGAQMESVNMKRHEARREDEARGALADFIMAQPGMQPHGLTGVASSAPSMPAPAPIAPQAAPADPLAPLPDTPQASDTPITVTGHRAPVTSSVPMSDSWASYVHADPKGAMKFLLDRASLGADQAKAVAGQMETIAELTRRVTDQQSYTAALRKAGELGFDTSHLPSEYNPQIVASIQNQAMSASEYLSSQRQDRNVDSQIADREADTAETERHHKAEEGNTRRGQDMADERGRRGQDIGSRDRQRGQDKSSFDRQRGQDMRGKGRGSARATIIVNPKTGQRMKLENGAWVPA